MRTGRAIGRKYHARVGWVGGGGSKEECHKQGSGALSMYVCTVVCIVAGYETTASSIMALEVRTHGANNASYILDLARFLFRE